MAKRDIYKEAEKIIRSIKTDVSFDIFSAEGNGDADKMAYARAAEYYIGAITVGVNGCNHYDAVMDVKIAAEDEKACQEIKTLADIWAVEGSDKMWADRHNGLIDSTKRYIKDMLTLCNRNSSPLQYLAEDVMQLDRYMDRIRKDLAKQREKLKTLRTKRVEQAK